MGVNDDDRLPTIQYLHQGVERLVAQVLSPAVGSQFHPVGPKRVERIDSLGNGRIDIGQGQRSTKAEMLGTGSLQPGTGIVVLSHDPTTLVTVAKPGLRCRHREYSAPDTRAVHEGPVRIGLPRRQGEALLHLGSMTLDNLPIKREYVVTVHIDNLAGMAHSTTYSHKPNQ